MSRQRNYLHIRGNIILLSAPKREDDIRSALAAWNLSAGISANIGPDVLGGLRVE